MLKTLTLLGVLCIALAQPEFHHPPHHQPFHHHAHRHDGIVFPQQSGEDYSSSSGSSGEVDKFTFNKPQGGGNSVYGGGRPQLGGGGRPQGGGGGRPQGGGGIPQQQQQPGGAGRPRNGGLQVLFSWKQVDFVFPNSSMRDNMLRNQQFIPRNNLILDVDVYGEGQDRRVFVTLPRVRPGVPATLARVSSRKRNGKNLLRPFPSWEAQVPGDCNGITSVFRTHIDPCGRLWVLDSGNNNAFNGQGSRIVCNPQVLIYDLRNNDRLLGRYRIPMSMIESNTLLVTIAVDTRRADCSDAYAYIADSIAYKMIVFNLRTQQFWRINSIHFFPYPDQSRFTVNGVSFDLMGGVFGLSIGPKYRNKRRLYFHCIDSVRQSWVDTDDLRNQTLWRDNMNAKPRAFNLFSGARSSQSASATMDEDGIMYFGLIGSNEVSCWNSRHRFAKSNLVSLAKDNVNLQFNSGIKVYGNKLYVATSRLQNYITSQVKEDEENYRVLEGDVNQLTLGTKCQTGGPLATRDEAPDLLFLDSEADFHHSFHTTTYRPWPPTPQHSYPHYNQPDSNDIVFWST